jgi:hypothetical protein
MEPNSFQMGLKTPLCFIKHCYKLFYFQNELFLKIVQKKKIINEKFK